VALSPDRVPEPVRCIAFGCFTADLREKGRWLTQNCKKVCAVHRPTLQSTGGDWIPCLRFSNSRGWRWYLVSAQHTKNVPGLKSDVEECQWLLKLHSFGLLSNSFQAHR
jgi:transposase